MEAQPVPRVWLVVVAVLAVALTGSAQGFGGFGGRGGRGRIGAGAASAPGPDISVPQYYKPQAVAQGKVEFAAHCASCHGADARGGVSGKPNVPDLIRNKLMMDDIGGKQLAAYLKTGTPAHNMPAFPDLNAAQVFNIASFLHYNIAFAANRFDYKLPDDFVGNPAAGKAFFYGSVGKCSTCHSATGDMKGLAARNHDSAPAIQALIVDGAPQFGGFGRRGPGGASSTAPTDTVTLKSGQSFTGVPVEVSDFVVSIRLPNGETRSWLRQDGWPQVTEHDPLQVHHDLAMKMTDADIHNLAAYLETLK